MELELKALADPDQFDEILPGQQHAVDDYALGVDPTPQPLEWHLQAVALTDQEALRQALPHLATQARERKRGAGLGEGAEDVAPVFGGVTSRASAAQPWLGRCRTSISKWRCAPAQSVKVSLVGKSDCMACRFSLDRLLAPSQASDDATFDAHPQPSIAMRTTINIDDALLAKAAKLAGPLDRSAVVHEGLKALIERESARRLARLGGSQPALKAAPRRRGGVKA